MAEELKPCPFCGGCNLSSGGDAAIVGVWCRDCQAVGPNHYGQHEWNTRATQKAKQGELKAITDAVWSEYQDSISKKWTFRKEHVDNAIRRALAELKGATND